MNTQIVKNRNREAYSFANINLLGKCTADCYFCLGKDLSEEYSGQNQTHIPFQKWKNFERFLDNCRSNHIEKLYLTGQTADGLQVYNLGELVDYLQNDKGFIVGLRSNGILAENRMNEIQKMKGEIGYSIHSLSAKKNKIIMGRLTVPNWDKIIPMSGNNVRISIVLNRYNKLEAFHIIKYASSFENVKYIQIRRISTETRLEYLQQDIDAFEDFYNSFERNGIQKSEYALAPIYELYGKDIVFWRTVETSVNSLNYFTDGTCSDEYFVVEGYLKYKGK
jgi:MoaA/NifB/PqqE/SkfB family radical SAM enzyme